MRPRQVWGAILLLLIGSQAICVRAQQAPAAAAADPRAVIALEAGTQERGEAPLTEITFTRRS